MQATRWAAPGRAFIATRENAPLAASLGIDVFRIKLLGFVVATAVAGVAGGVCAMAAALPASASTARV